ncbi:MAG: hypothetical protein ACYST9_01305, partial [Planctomycetota bacterium]
LLPTEVGKALNADLVLHVVIENYSLNEMATTGYLRGFMHSQNALFDVKSDERLWPESPTSRAVKVGFEVEERGKEFAAGRLFMALSHCTVRYLYNSPKLKFRIADDRGTLGWESWNR